MIDVFASSLCAEFESLDPLPDFVSPEGRLQLYQVLLFGNVKLRSRPLVTSSDLILGLIAQVAGVLVVFEFASSAAESVGVASHLVSHTALEVVVDYI